MWGEGYTTQRARLLPSRTKHPHLTSPVDGEESIPLAGRAGVGAKLAHMEVRPPRRKTEDSHWEDHQLIDSLLAESV